MLSMPESIPKILLGSRSPRRGLLLREAGWQVHQVDPPFADPDHPEDDRSQSPAEIAKSLAKTKALSVIEKRELWLDFAPSILIAGDTMCVGHDGTMIGKPSSADHARTMIQSFISQTHAVLTGVCVAILDPLLPSSTEFELQTLSDEAEVVFGDLSDDDLENYLQTDQWQGKAGGYNLFDRQEAGWPISIEGDPTTVVGLPMRMLQPLVDSLWQKLQPTSTR